MKRIYTVYLAIIIFAAAGCSSGPQREAISRQIREAELTLQQAQGLEAPVYAPEAYLEAQLTIRQAKESMAAEHYAEAGSLADEAKKIGQQASAESRDEQVRVKAEAERLLSRGAEIWQRYETGDEKNHAAPELLEIKRLLDEGFSSLEKGRFMDAMDASQQIHQKLALVPERFEKAQRLLLEEQTEKDVLTQSAEEIIKAAQHKATQIIEDARGKAREIIVEAQVDAAKARLEEFERIYPSTYKVKEGETIIDIARRREIFNDPFMWPLIYKANRDQMRDPKVVFPDQVLTIPRNLTFEEIIESRKQSGAPPPYIPPHDAYNPEFYRRYLLIQPEQLKSPDREASRPSEAPAAP